MVKDQYLLLVMFLVTDGTPYVMLLSASSVTKNNEKKIFEPEEWWNPNSNFEATPQIFRKWHFQPGLSVDI